MNFKRFVQLATVAIALTSVSASAQQVLKVGSTPTGAPFTFLDTKTNTIQGLMVDLITEIAQETVDATGGFQAQVQLVAGSYRARVAATEGLAEGVSSVLTVSG